MDRLTGLPGLRRLHDTLGGLLGLGRDLSVVIAVVDIDNFHLLNDTVGTEGGNRLLFQVAQAIAASVGPGDIIGRLSGDDILVIMPSASVELGIRTLEHVRKSIAATNFSSPNSVALPISASSDLVVYPIDEREKAPLLRGVELALNQAK